MQRLLIGSLLFYLVAIGSVYAASSPLPGPPKDLSDIQKSEWTIGIITGYARQCGAYSKAREISTFMKKSPYFKRGQSGVMQFDGVRGCGEIPKYLEEILGEKDLWQEYINTVYPDR